MNVVQQTRLYGEIGTWVSIAWGACLLALVFVALRELVRLIFRRRMIDWHWRYNAIPAGLLFGLPAIVYGALVI